MSRKILLLVILIIVAIFIVARITGIAITFKINTNNMMPRYHNKEIIWASNLKKPTYGNIICFKSFSGNAKNRAENISISRLFGLEGDTIELNDGYLLRNGIIADIPDKLIFTYFAKKSHIYDFKLLSNLSIPPIITNDSVILSLNSAEYKKFSYNILLHKIISPCKLKQYHALGNKIEECRLDNDILIVIPKGYCFVMGDNRGEAFYPLKSGLVPLQNIIATVFY